MRYDPDRKSSFNGKNYIDFFWFKSRQENFSDDTHRSYSFNLYLKNNCEINFHD